MPYGTLLDPIYASPTSDQIVGYTRCGDSALWTGAYLAAESFRFKMTQAADALANVKGALAGLKGLVDVTGDNRLARCMVPADSPYAGGIANEEAANTIHQNPPWIWIDNTSRDQVVGVFFGLGVAFDLVDDAGVKATVSDIATRMIGFISRHQWSPNDDISNTFELRPEELQMLLQVARHVNPSNTVSGPFLVPPVETGVLVDVQSLGSYFKFNLDYMSFYQLVRLQTNDDNKSAYTTVRNFTATHQNAFFNMVDRALNGANATRDAETRSLLDQWLLRPRRDFTVDVSSKVAVCGSEACQPVPVPLRPPATFLWEVDPFQLKGGGAGIIENAGVDYILPYWMARYYGVIAGSVQSSAAPSCCDRAGVAGFAVRAEPGERDCAGGIAAAAAIAGRDYADGDGRSGSPAERTVTLRVGGADQLPGSRQCGGGDGDVRSGGWGRAGERDGNGAVGGADVVQHERDWVGRGGGAGGGGAGGESADAIAGAGVPVRREWVRGGADRAGSGYAGVRELLWHGHSQCERPGECDGNDQRDDDSGDVCGCGAGVRGPGPGERGAAAFAARQRGDERFDHGRRADFERGHDQRAVIASDTL